MVSLYGKQNKQKKNHLKVFSREFSHIFFVYDIIYQEHAEFSEFLLTIRSHSVKCVMSLMEALGLFWFQCIDTLVVLMLCPESRCSHGIL